MIQTCRYAMRKTGQRSKNFLMAAIFLVDFVHVGAGTSAVLVFLPFLGFLVLLLFVAFLVDMISAPTYYVMIILHNLDLGSVQMV